MKEKKRDRAWFEQKVSELGAAIERLPDERQLELFEVMDGGRRYEPASRSSQVQAAVDAYAPSPERREK